MNPIIIIFSLILINTFGAMGQSRIATAGRLIINADSVILISHVGTEENHDKPEGFVLPPGTVEDTKPIVFPSFFVGEDINPAIVVQRQFLLRQDVVAIAKIIQRPVKSTNFGYVPLCFEPHHAILIYNKGRFSYIDLCFHCSGLVTSSNLKLNNTDFKDGKWKEMKVFFLKHGLTYEMEDKH
jgi:hypothetical protein